jgi:hypothetical protein
MFNRMFAELHVCDCDAAAQFFEQALGYRRGYTLMENGQLDFAVMDHPDPGLQFTLHCMLPADDATKPRCVRLYFEPQDIHQLCADLRAKRFKVTSPKPTNYGATTAQLDGPDGYAICFQQWNRKPKG